MNDKTVDWLEIFRTLAQEMSQWSVTNLIQDTDRVFEAMQKAAKETK